MNESYGQFDEVLIVASRIIESNEKCRSFITEKQEKLGSEYSVQIDRILLRPGGREVTLRVLFPGASEGCEVVLDVDREIVRSVKNYLGTGSYAT